jgi:hypothetical protein
MHTHTDCVRKVHGTKMHTHTHTHTNTHTRTHAHTHTRTHAHAHTYAHTHTHTLTQPIVENVDGNVVYSNILVKHREQKNDEWYSVCANTSATHWKCV